MAFDLGSKFTRKAKQYTEGAIGKALPGNDPISKVGRNFLNASSNRLVNAGLDAFGANTPGSFLNNIVTAVFRDNDTRVRLSLSPNSNILYKSIQGNRLLEPLLETDGILFPYTPTVSVSHTAQYTGTHPAHSNYVQQSYNASSVDVISLDGYFTANNADEARYVFAVLHFLRSAYKMFFGTDENRGTPPPVLRLSGYGPFNYNSVPVVLSNFSEIMAADRDYIEVPLAASPDAATKTMIPTFMNMTITLNPVYSKRQIGNFGLERFARGDLIGSPGKGGGFL
tara:strand:+ start:554 stop:1402 length:849 start_codon:yes stop_codon:yes gene_type:complete